jgi:hypothetical protein
VAIVLPMIVIQPVGVFSDDRPSGQAVIATQFLPQPFTRDDSVCYQPALQQSLDAYSYFL